MESSGGGHAKTFEGMDKQWYHHVQDGNNEVVYASEGYTRHEDAEAGLDNALLAAVEAAHARGLIDKPIRIVQ